MMPVGGRGGGVRSRSQPLQNYHLAARHDPPVKPRKLQYLRKSQKTKFQKHLAARTRPTSEIVFYVKLLCSEMLWLWKVYSLMPIIVMISYMSDIEDTTCGDAISGDIVDITCGDIVNTTWSDLILVILQILPERRVSLVKSNVAPVQSGFFRMWYPM